MSTQLLFYEQAVPVSAEKHRNWGLVTGFDYSFAKRVNSVPITAVEFPRAALEYALVFAGNEAGIMPAVVLGIEDHKNLYVDPPGRWTGRYVPAFVRRYPFVFSSNDGANLTLCLDGGFAGWNQEGKGQRLFDDSGKRTEYLENILKFLRQYQVEFQRTQNFCKKLKELDLLEPVHAQFTARGGERRSLGGFMAISRDKLKKLPAETLAQLAATDELELVYLHLHSLNHFEALLARAARGSGKTGGGKPTGAGGQNAGSRTAMRPAFGATPARQSAPAESASADAMAKKKVSKKPVEK